MSADEIAELVEIIQKATAGLSDSQKMHIAKNWIWMGNELTRAVSSATQQ